MPIKPNISDSFKLVDPYSQANRQQKHVAAVEKFRKQQTDSSIHSNRFDS
jgi:hypothetical protein